MLPQRFWRAGLVWGLLFVVSVLVFLASIQGWNPFRPPLAGDVAPGMEASTEPPWLAILGTGASCLSAATGFAGLGWTMIVGWRRETRDAQRNTLERERLELEIAKQREELARLRGKE